MFTGSKYIDLLNFRRTDFRISVYKTWYALIEETEIYCTDENDLVSSIEFFLNAFTEFSDKNMSFSKRTRTPATQPTLV